MQGSRPPADRAVGQPKPRLQHVDNPLVQTEANGSRRAGVDRAGRRAWHSWLTEHHGDVRGVWLVLAKKGTTEPTSLTYDQALEEALCFGWVDGQLGPGDEATFRRRFTPRRPGSSWSKRNVALVELLARQERMRPSGLAAVERARADGSWGSAYSGQAAIEVPSDLATALAAHPAAHETFDNLTPR